MHPIHPPVFQPIQPFHPPVYPSNGCVLVGPPVSNFQHPRGPNDYEILYNGNHSFRHNNHGHHNHGHHNNGNHHNHGHERH